MGSRVDLLPTWLDMMHPALLRTAVDFYPPVSKTEKAQKVVEKILNVGWQRLL